MADEVKNHIFGRNTWREAAIDAQLQCFGFRLQQRLSRHDVLDFARADAECERAESAVGRRVAIAADDCHAGLCVALLGADNVDNPLPRVVNIVQRDAELFTVVAKRIDLLLRDRVENWQTAIGRGNVVVDRRQRQFRSANRPAGEAEAFKRLRARNFVHQMQVDIQNRLPAGLVVDDVIVPDFFEQCTWFCAHRYLPSLNLQF